MIGDSGIYVKFTNLKGEEKHGRAMKSKQTASFQKVGKIFIELMDGEYKDFLRDDSGKKLISLASSSKTTITGYIN